MDPILLRGLERIFITVGAVIFAYLGYRLFLKGKDSGPGTLEVKSDLLKVVVSGQGPGLFFMAFGAVVLMFSILSGGAKVSESGSELKNVSSDYNQALSRINDLIANIDPASRQDIAALRGEIEEIKDISEYFRTTELKMVAPLTKYTNDDLGDMIERLSHEVQGLNSTVQELTKRSTQTGTSAGAKMPSG